MTKVGSSRIVDDLKSGVMEGYPTPLSMIKIVMTAFSTVAATNYISDLTSISVMQTELGYLVQNSAEQHKATITSMEHLAVSWNTFTNSLSGFTSELDKRTLNMSNITHPHPTRIPLHPLTQDVPQTIKLEI